MTYTSFTKNQEFYVEAKFMRTRAENDDADLAPIRAKLTEAVNDSKNLRCVSPAKGVGILFLSPSFRTFDMSEIKQWTERVRQIKHDALAWLF